MKKKFSFSNSNKPSVLCFYNQNKFKFFHIFAHTRARRSPPAGEYIKKGFNDLSKLLRDGRGPFFRPILPEMKTNTNWYKDRIKFLLTMKKSNYLIKRIIAATIDVLFFALIVKILEPILEYHHTDGKTYIHTSLFFLLFYMIFIIQDVLFNKTVGKYLLKFEIKFDNNNEVKGYKKHFKLIIRRTFDILELVCPFIYILTIIFTKKNQKLGDLISGIIILEKNSSPQIFE